jgi:cytochrome c-type biogenesis protein CcmF
MNAAIGRDAVLLGFLAAVVGAVTLAVGLVRRRPGALRNGVVYAGLLLLAALVAAGAMEHGLISHDFSLTYVAQNNSRETPLLFTVTGMWSALEGSILLWALILSGYIAAMAWRFRRRAEDPIVGWATLTCFVVAAFFFGLMLGPANPFRTVTGAVPLDGLGPNPLLQDHPLVAFHPPLLYLGFVGFTIPFSFAVAALVTGRLGEGWLVETRRWTLFAWGLLTVGIVLGAWWSYQVLGWGGFWAWDPVENASFLPWLCGTAYLHSVMAQERRGLLRVWNLSLLMATFSLTILGTFLTRSGVLQSVHAFSQSTLGPIILGFFGLVVAVGLGLIAWRGDRLRSPGSIDSPVSREGGFLVNNLLFAGFALVVLLGTVFPLLSEAVQGQQISVGRPYFDTMARPIGLALLFFMAVAPVLPWRKASGELLRSRLQWPAWAGTLVVVGCVAAGIRGLAVLLAFGLGAFAGTSALRQLVVSTRMARRRGVPLWSGLVGRTNGGMVVHLGVVLIAVALSASLSFGHRGQVQLKPGQSTQFAGHTLTYLGTRGVVHPNRRELEAAVRVDGGGVYRPAVSQFGSDAEGIGTPSVASSLTSDVYLTLDTPPEGATLGGGPPPSSVSGQPGGAPGSTSGATQTAPQSSPLTQPAVIGVVVQPMVAWLWIGGAVMGLGAVMAALPERRRRAPGEPEPEPATVVPAVSEPDPEPVVARSGGGS